VAKILVVDDVAYIRLLFQIELKDAGYDVDVAENGPQAIRKVQLSKPDLVLLDLSMPGMGGMEVLEEIRRQTPNMPVIVITAHSMRENVLRARSLGAVDFLAKPVDADELKAKVGHILSNRYFYIKKKGIEGEPAFGRPDSSLRAEKPKN
jgi:CheY-like chemotaxis protein